MADYAAQIEQLQATLHNLAVSMAYARQAGDDAALAGLKAQFDAVKQQVDALVAAQKGIESPSSFSLGLADVGTSIATALRNVSVLVALGIGAFLVWPFLTRRR